MSLSYSEAAGKLMVALDYSSAEQAKTLIRELEGIPCYMKVGMQLFYAAGADFVKELKASGYKVFLDLKLHDIPNTVKGGANSITRLGVDMFNVHAAGGKNMMASAMEGVLEALEDHSERRPLVIGVTQLTSTDQETMNREIGIPGSVESAVLSYASLTKEAGLDGVVASPLEVPAIKAHCGKDFITVTPGIRPAGSSKGDQSRTLTPAEAVRSGTDYMVIGRPITGAAVPREAAEQIIGEMMEA
ncbi:orotidine 5'-phosphate decarboxylase [Paenibacillus antibioticophila]|uniref:Orotidine 5'-phosphate decarboxylase n=1 Tax=Paenibacillus antibioticophila TaxID=1274374 RepID=A0A919Y140_9BACL|nr:orotidine-5'-phosphate decarboxylase [Paenibacillus antibioticophila]GIO40115.1 orotidine 5'-phosphate decarboxylase [Paenibacillus antibioticophila]